ncbi:Uracil phosphoribosyltransferase [Mycena indigotica]|uniref:Uracil phosphoribosyltransferase n=1 Tax=Mycena indigotica TaxID=2126181 RepID=A0A8H6SM68_9AGAR|nr:Uracil phosphoribosyltransferase [Mycena indigotica]KAF7301395.1 Uracil phosphoribosyltransferase [Mycena indigotica]
MPWLRNLPKHVVRLEFVLIRSNSPLDHPAMANRPTYIYKIISHTSPLPDPLPDELPLSDLDAADGFMHFSTAKQVPRTLKRFFSTDPRVTIVRIDYSKVEREVKWEDSKGTGPGEVGGDDIFPHIYGRSMKATDVESSVIWERNEDWDVALESETGKSWLVY